MEDFERAIETSNSFKRKPNDSELLKLYSLYKQSTIGDCNTCIYTFLYHQLILSTSWNV